MKRILAGMMVATLAAAVMVVLAEEPAINPARVATPQINAYGSVPIQIQGTNMTASAAQLNAAGGGSTAALTPTTVVVSSTLGVTGKTTLTGGLGGTGWVVTNTFAAGEYTQRLYYAVGNVLTNMTTLP